MTLADELRALADTLADDDDEVRNHHNPMVRGLCETADRLRTLAAKVDGKVLVKPHVGPNSKGGSWAFVPIKCAYECGGGSSDAEAIAALQALLDGERP